MKVLRALGLLLALVLWLAVGFAGTGCATEPTSDTSACERLSPSGICASVYGFAAHADNPLGHVELCVRAEDLSLAEEMYGPAHPSWDERFSRLLAINVDPSCFWICPPNVGRGCNAYGGCLCLESSP